MYEAWRAVRRNRGAAGIDKVSIQMFEKNLAANLDALLRELKQGLFRAPARATGLHSQGRQANEVSSAGNPGSP